MVLASASSFRSVASAATTAIAATVTTIAPGTTARQRGAASLWAGAGDKKMKRTTPPALATAALTGCIRAHVHDVALRDQAMHPSRKS